MPRVTAVSAPLRDLLDRQSDVVTVAQLVSCGFPRTVAFRRAREGRWRQLLPAVMLTAPTAPTRTQLQIAAWLYGGPASAIDGADACRWHGMRLPPSPPVHLVAPVTSSARSRGFVVVRRTVGEIRVRSRGAAVPYVELPTALIVAARNLRTERDAVALLSRALQEGLTTVGQLHVARQCIGDKWCRPVDGALVAVGVGVRSPAEADFRRLVLGSRVLPEPWWNQWLHLDDGGSDLCVDGLWADAGMVGEVLGKTYHAWGQQYDDTIARKERLQAMGLVVAEATPAHIRRHGSAVIDTLERTYRLHRGRGLPDGVRLIDGPGNCAHHTL